MKKLNIITLLTSILIIDCKINNQIIKKDPYLDKQYCNDAEERLLQLQCEEGKPTKRGKSFYELCQELESNGIFLNAKCLAKINDCDQVSECTGSE